MVFFSCSIIVLLMFLVFTVGFVFIFGFWFRCLVALAPCLAYSRALLHCFCTLLWYSHTLLQFFHASLFCTLLLYVLCLATSCFAFMRYCAAFTPCYSHLSPSHYCLAIMHPHALLPTTFKYLLAPPPHCCFVALLLCLISWYSFLTVLCKWRSLEQHQQASSNNMFFFSLNFSSFFFLFFVCCLFLFLCSLSILICCCFVCLCARLKFKPLNLI